MQKIFLMSVLLLLVNLPALAQENPKIFINEQVVNSISPPLIIDNRVMVPLRVIFQALDHKVIWNEKTQAISSEDIYLKINDKTAKVGNEPIQLDVPAQLFENNSVTYIPLRFITESLGKEVRWDEKNNKVVIIDNYQKYIKYLARICKTCFVDSVVTAWNGAKKVVLKIKGKAPAIKETEAKAIEQENNTPDKEMIVIPYGLEKKFLQECNWFIKKKYLRKEMGDYVIYQQIHK